MESTEKFLIGNFLEVSRIPPEECSRSGIRFGEDYLLPFLSLFRGTGSFARHFPFSEGQAVSHDIQATLLHCLGFDHELLTYRTQGRDFRLTDIHGRVVREVLA